MKFTYTTHIAHPVTRVFQYLNDSEIAVQWVDNLIAIEPLTEGGNRVGAKSRHTYLENGRQFTMIEETIAYEPNRRFKFQGETDTFHLIVDYQLTAENNGTRIQIDEEIRPKSFFMRLMLPFATGMMKKQTAQGLEKLKSLLDHAN